MRGNPIKEWIIFSALWLLLLIPVLKLTVLRKSDELTNEHNQEATAIEEAASASAIFRYTDPPLFIRITQNGKTLCKLDNPSPGGTEQEIPLIVEDNSTELQLQAEWPHEKKHVLEIELIVDGKDEQKQHYWSGKVMDEIVSFSWR